MSRESTPVLQLWPSSLTVAVPTLLTNILEIFLQLVGVLSTAPFRLVAYCVLTTFLL